MNASERQYEVLRLFGSLVSLRDDWRRRMLLACDESAELAAIAVSLAGGTTLLVERDGLKVKAAMRRGELDFVVNSLDEALRVLKNEIRQGRPLGVGLISPVADVLREMAERGVRPDAMRGDVDWPYAAEMNVVRVKELEQSAVLFGGQRCRAWQVSSASAAGLREVDEQLLGVTPEDDLLRRRWLQQISKYMRNSVEGGRWVWLSEAEVGRLPQGMAISPGSR